MTRDFNAFVVACTPIVRSEVRRLNRQGGRFSVEDVIQGALLDLLESEHLFPASPTLEAHGALARLHVRHRLINDVVVYSKAKKRTGFVVPVDDAKHIATSSREDEIIEYVDAQRILETCPMPPLDGGSREARRQRRDRWTARVRRVFKPNLIRTKPRALAQTPANDNAFITKEAA